MPQPVIHPLREMPIPRIPFDELAANVLLVLEQHRAANLHRLVAERVVDGALWWASNAKGKGDVCVYWSERAAAVRQSWADVPYNGSWRGKSPRLIHEHVIPRAYLRQKLLDRHEPDTAFVRMVLDRSINCIVEEGEDHFPPGLTTNMPRGWDWEHGDSWVRYAPEHANIPIYQGPHPAPIGLPR